MVLDVNKKYILVDSNIYSESTMKFLFLSKDMINGSIVEIEKNHNYRDFYMIKDERRRYNYHESQFVPLSKMARLLYEN